MVVASAITKKIAQILPSSNRAVLKKETATTEHKKLNPYAVTTPISTIAISVNFGCRYQLINVVINNPITTIAIATCGVLPPMMPP